MTQQDAGYPDLYVRGIELFNAREFFECHDVLEELWTETLGEERLFYQGLIQASVALFHFGNANLGGARKLYYASTKKLTPYAPVYMSLNVERFLKEFERCFAELIAAGTVYPDDVVLHEERIPRWDFREEGDGDEAGEGDPREGGEVC